MVLRNSGRDQHQYGSLRVAVNAQLPGNGTSGGVQQAVAGLVYGLGRLTDGDEEYLIACAPGQGEWLAPYLGPNQRIVERPVPAVDRLALGLAGVPVLRPVLPLARLVWRGSVVRYRARRQQGRRAASPAPADPLPADGLFQQLGADVVHFPYQTMERVSVPSVFTPWDFQHERYPEFFTDDTLRWRRSFYPAACRAASAVVAGSPGVRDDICRYAGVAPEKVYLMPWGNPLELAGPPPTRDALEAIAARLALPPAFALYPAQTWPHKNHMRLVQALAQLRDNRGLVVQLVCTGRQNAFFPEIEHEVRRLGLEDQVRFVGYVDDTEMRALYRLASFVVFPSLFEGWGFPAIEALSEGVPLACAAIPPLIDHVADAAVLFDPTSVESIADSVAALATNPELRATLGRRGLEQAGQFMWERCARSHRALYRLLGGVALTDEDRHLLAEASSGEPEPTPVSKGLA